MPESDFSIRPVTCPGLERMIKAVFKIYESATLAKGASVWSITWANVLTESKWWRTFKGTSHAGKSEGKMTFVNSFILKGSAHSVDVPRYTWKTAHMHTLDTISDICLQGNNKMEKVKVSLYFFKKQLLIDTSCRHGATLAFIWIDVSSNKWKFNIYFPFSCNIGLHQLPRAI